MSTWPTTGTRVVVWSERSPSRAPRDSHVSTVDHVPELIFTVAAIDATFNRSTGRSKPVRRGAGAFSSETYIAVDAKSDRAHEVHGETRRDRDAEARRAVHSGLADMSEANGRAAVAALEALDER